MIRIGAPPPPSPAALPTRLPCTCGPETGRCAGCQAWDAWNKRKPETSDISVIVESDDPPRPAARPALALPVASSEDATFQNMIQEELLRLYTQQDTVWCDIDQLQKALNRLEEQSAALETYLGLKKTPATPPRLRIMNTTKIGRPISLHSDVVHIEHVLQRSASPLHYKEILARLETEEQVTLGGRAPGNNLRARLHAYPQFLNLGKGYYTLAQAQPSVP